MYVVCGLHPQLALVFQEAFGLESSHAGSCSSCAAPTMSGNAYRSRHDSLGIKRNLLCTLAQFLVKVMDGHNLLFSPALIRRQKGRKLIPEQGHERAFQWISVM